MSSKKSSPKNQSLGLLRNINNSVYFHSLLILCFEKKDETLRESLVKFMADFLTDAEIRRIYRVCSKFLKKRGMIQEEIEFLNYLTTGEK